MTLIHPILARMYNRLRCILAYRACCNCRVLVSLHMVIDLNGQKCHEQVVFLAYETTILYIRVVKCPCGLVKCKCISLYQLQ